MSASLVIAAALPGAGGEIVTAAAAAVAAASLERVRDRGAVLVAELGGERRRGPTILASTGARRLEDALRGAGLAAAARGAVCWARLGAPDEDPLAELRAALRAAGGEAAAAFACLPAAAWRAALEDERLRVAGGILRAELPAQRSLAALAVRELHAAGVRAKVATRTPGVVAARRALAGLDPGGTTGQRSRALARSLLGPRPARPLHPHPTTGARAGGRGANAGGQPDAPGQPPGSGRRGAGERYLARRERGQAMPLAIGAVLATIAAALALVALGGAVTGKARAQRVADLAAVSAARSMRDDYERLFAPASLAGGEPNPRHLAHRDYLRRAIAAARGAGRRNGADPARIRVSFPDRDSFAPLRARVEVTSTLQIPDGSAERSRPRTSAEIETAAEAALSPPAETDAGAPRTVSGDEYAGPLAHRQGVPMRPDVARAFDRLERAARASGLALLVTSGYRSNEEQERLYARNPDPRWVAPPGRSLHRCATELDLGPPAAYGWLAATASRFGFRRRYPWEPWHFGFTRGAPPCSAAEAGRSRSGRGGAGPDRAAGDGGVAAGSLPAYVPPRFRSAIARAASRHGVSAAVLAAQLLAESNFNPFAVSPAGARGIAQFMPATAAAYGLRDPFDPVAAIDAQARLMSDLLRRLGSLALALAAYNAGPAPVAACSCVPSYPETQAYVARILGLLDGAGELTAPALEVRLVS